MALFNKITAQLLFLAFLLHQYSSAEARYLSGWRDLFQQFPNQCDTFRNPIKINGPDPQMAQRDGNYYFMVTRTTELRLWKTQDPTVLDDANSVVIFTPPPTGPYSANLWAPEIHYVQGAWYVYFSAEDLSVVNSRRLYVLRNTNNDPTVGSWEFLGKLQTDPADTWAIDPSVFEKNGQLYLTFAGFVDNNTPGSKLYITSLSNPTTVSSPRILISQPQYPWEFQGTPGGVNEGPIWWQHDNLGFLTFSASDCSSDNYALGTLTIPLSADPLNAGSWNKSTEPVFIQNPQGSVYAVGHNGFFKSPDGTQDWIIFHANPGAGQGCSTQRSTHAQMFQYNPDGSPFFGFPIPLDQDIPKPSGVPGSTS